MNVSQRARTASTLLLAAAFTGGLAAAGLAQSAPGTAPGTAPATGSSMAPAAPSVSSPSGGNTANMPANGAATATPGSATAAHRHGHHGRHAAGRMQGESMAQIADQRIADLHTRLHITTQQEGPWDQFAQVMRDNAKALDAAYQQRAAKFAGMNAVENMQSYADIEQTRAQGVQKLVQPFQTLYAALSPQQKEQADTLFRNFAAKAQQHHKAAPAAATKH
jgi:hypothetical protein